MHSQCVVFVCNQCLGPECLNLNNTCVYLNNKNITLHILYIVITVTKALFHTTTCMIIVFQCIRLCSKYSLAFTTCSWIITVTLKGE